MPRKAFRSTGIHRPLLSDVLLPRHAAGTTPRSWAEHMPQKAFRRTGIHRPLLSAVSLPRRVAGTTPRSRAELVPLSSLAGAATHSEEPAPVIDVPRVVCADRRLEAMSDSAYTLPQFCCCINSIVRLEANTIGLTNWCRIFSQ